MSTKMVKTSPATRPHRPVLALSPLRRTGRFLLVLLLAAVPVYFFVGRWDVNAMRPLAVDVMSNTVLAQTQLLASDTDSYSGYFDTHMSAYLHEYGIAGAVVAVVENGEPAHLAGYGFANLEDHVPMDAKQSVVHIGSAGKTFTALAIMQLVEQSLIDLDADVTTYIDFDIPATYPEPITIRHLLTHTSGFEAHDRGIILLDADALSPSREYLIRNLPQRIRPPGAAIGYSNYGLTLLGYVVERVSGMPLSDYLESAIITPLNMTHTSAQILPPETLTDSLAIGYAALKPQPTEYMAAFGAAPVRSTAADMANYMIANLQLGHLGDAQILQPETARSMQAQQFSAASDLNGIGFGFYEMSRNGQRIVGHLGTTNYFHTLMLLFPDEQTGIFVSFNSAEGAQVLRSGRFMDDLMNHFFPQSFTAVTPPDDFAQRADDYTGTYFWNNRFGQTTIEKLFLLPEAVTISATPDNRLRVESGGIGRTFTETEEDRFVRSDGHDVMVFHRDEGGQVTSASLNSRTVFTLERRTWYESPAFTIAVLVSTGLIFIAGLIITGITLWHNREYNISLLATLSQWSAVLVPLLYLVFVAGLVVLVPGIVRGTSSDVVLRLVLLLPMIALTLTLLLAGITLMEWVQGVGSVWIRLQHTALVMAGVAFTVILNIWNLLGWRL